MYARLRAPGGDGTIALHQAGPGVSVASDGVRLYFEVRELDDFCTKLQRKGFYITQLPRMMPWGWRHAYLNDPDGHEISLYWAGEIRMAKTVMQAAKDAAKGSSRHYAWPWMLRNNSRPARSASSYLKSLSIPPILRVTVFGDAAENLCMSAARFDTNDSRTGE